MSKPAFIRWNGKRNGQERRAELRSGEKGQGQVIHAVNYWPESGPSRDAAYDAFLYVAKSDGYEIVGSDNDQE